METCIYIPLCYLLNFSGKAIEAIATLIYIPLCYLLNFDENPRLVIKNNLHSTMLSIKLLDNLSNKFQEVIYIPLCYLLNVSLHLQEYIDYMYLHSTMLSIKFKCKF